MAGAPKTLRALLLTASVASAPALADESAEARTRPFCSESGLFADRCPGGDDARAEPPVEADLLREPIVLLSPSSTGSAKTWVQPKWTGREPDVGSYVATGVIAAGWVALWADGSKETIRDVGDITQLLPAAAGLGMALGARDKQGLIQYGIALGVSSATVHTLKAVNEKYRPDASDSNSYPSGHTQASFFGASYIYRRYGPKWGIPATVLASYTGFSRVHAQKHFADDVISGASIAVMSNWLFTKPADPERAARSADMTRQRNLRFEWETSDGRVGKNLVQAPRDVGTLIDWQFDQEADPQITASIAFDLRLSRHSRLKLRYSPFEIRDIGTLATDTRFGERVFPAGTDIFSVYFLGDLRIRYAHDFFPQSRFDLQLGGGVSIVESDLDLGTRSDQDGSIRFNFDDTEGVHEFGALPIVYARIGVDIIERFGIYVEGDAIDLSDERFLDVAAKARFPINAKWEVAAGYRWVSDRLEIDTVFNDFERDGALFHVAYSF